MAPRLSNKLSEPWCSATLEGKPSALQQLVPPTLSLRGLALWPSQKMMPTSFPSSFMKTSNCL